MKFIPLFILLSFSTSCETLERMRRQSEESRKIRISKEDPAKDCQEKGSVDGSGTSSSSAKNTARLRAYHSGGNYLRQDAMDINREKEGDNKYSTAHYDFSGTAFYCSSIKNIDLNI